MPKWEYLQVEIWCSPNLRNPDAPLTDDEEVRMEDIVLGKTDQFSKGCGITILHNGKVIKEYWEANNKRPEVDEDFQKYLNQYGSLGWELIEYHSDEIMVRGWSGRMLFKRRVGDE